ncbi:MAG TPA: site-2 protease family protein, partial [Spirochaetales bacterium]|nr:site-2 protease family protein [Spirochaetales bacterium]
MTLLTILLGIAGLGLVVFFHELGHFIAARLVGITVEEFSLGWGPKLVGFTKGKTTYRISVLPLGGYCKMKGEDGYRKALEEGLEDFPRENGSYFGASPLKRIFVSLAGPFMNIVFAFAVFSCVLAIGYEERTWANRIV